jgi:hypothetical protein
VLRHETHHYYNPKFDTRKNRDVYENNLVSAILGGLGQDCGTCLRVRFAEVSENSVEQNTRKEVCCLTISPASRPVYVRDGQDEFFYIRAGNSNRRLSVSEAARYVQNRW